MPKKPPPQFVPPMQASSVKEPFDSPDRTEPRRLITGQAIICIVIQNGPVSRGRYNRSQAPSRIEFSGFVASVRVNLLNYAFLSFSDKACDVA
jgi:hypothetical protein